MIDERDKVSAREVISIKKVKNYFFTYGLLKIGLLTG